jgi:hypothetical protein
VFDFSNPDQSSPKRPQTTVPQQALFLMNSPFAIEQAKAIMSVPEVAGATGEEQRIKAIYKTVLARLPLPEELAISQQFIASSSDESNAPSQLNKWEQYAQLLLLTNEFMFVD